MSRFIETIRIADGCPQYLEYHQQRVNRTRAEVLGALPGLSLAAALHSLVVPDDAVYKCRLVYAEAVEDCQLTLYMPKQIRSVQLVYQDNIEYGYKYEDRKALELLRESTRLDEIIIVKNGLVTDASFANVVFRNGEGLVTPAQPLLRGTQRQRLIDSGRVREMDITPADVRSFTSFQLINAMLPLEAGTELPVSAIHF